MTVLSMLQDPRGKGGTATAVSFYRDWMAKFAPDHQELYLDERSSGGVRKLHQWDGLTSEVPRVLPILQAPPYVAARAAFRRLKIASSEVHVVGASALHGWSVLDSGPTLVWLATTLADERSPEVLRGRSFSRQLAYRTTRSTLERFERRVLQSAVRVIAMSPHTAEVVEELGVDSDRISVVLVPVDTTLFSPPPSDTPRRGVLFVGRAQDPRKGFDRLIEAFEQSTAIRSHGVSVISPGFPKSAALGMHWLGRVEHLPSHYRDARLLAMPSRQEGLGIVALEAMASGTPVVARQCGGVDAILEHSGGGVVTTDGPSFQREVEGLLADPDKAHEMGLRGRRWVDTHASRARLLDEPGLFRL